ncbi:O-antigen ligase family protein, partial [bacterium]|nr:O-antigen ligase family protein [bacterium]
FVTGILIVSALMPAGAGQTAGSKRTVNIGEELRSITATEKGSASWRLTAWKNTLYMIKSNPLFGVGIGNWQFHYPLYARKGAVDKDFNEERQAKRAHNDYLQITAELGFPGIVLFLWFMGNIVYIGLRLMFIERNFLLAFMGIVGVTSLLSLMGHAIFDFPFDESLPPFFTAVVSAMVVYAYMNSSQKIEKKVSF